MNSLFRRRLVVAFGLVGVLALSSNGFAQSHSSGGGSDGGKPVMKMGGKGKSQARGMMGQMAKGPGEEVQKCHGHAGMPPHYCEPVYHVASSVRGVAVEEVAPAGDTALIVTLKELNVTHPGVGQQIVVIGGAGDLAGAVVVDGGWKGNQKVQLNLTGEGSIYAHGKLHVHIFPLTGP